VANIAVLGRIRWDVVHHGQRAGRGPVVTVQVLKAPSACEAKRSRKCCQDGFGHDVVAGNSILQDLQVGAVLDVAGNVGRFALDLIAGDLDHLVAVPGVLKYTISRTNRLISWDYQHLVWC
jgi:hypothetical protein